MTDEFRQIIDHDADPIADTNPMRPVVEPVTVPIWRRVTGLLMLTGAVGFTIASVALFLIPTAPAVQSQSPATAIAATALPTQPEPNPTLENTTINAAPAVATLSQEGMAQILSQPLVAAEIDNGFTFVRNADNPFTRVPDRPRSEVVEYEVVSGDTLFVIAERFSIQPESIAWSNARSILGNLRPGLLLNIPPIDGAVELIANDRSIEDLAQGYSVDPYAIIDWESNGLFNAAPETVLRSGMRIFVPGGQGEQISWTPRVERSGGDGSGAGGTISFEPGEAGSCGQQPNPGGFGGWTRPLSGYTWVRGFSGIHSGVDLAAPSGTPVSAGLGGNIIFRGWNSYGYGYAVVIAHGPYTTLYGHLSDIYVACGQSVSPGAVIGAVGSTGDSSGPHLHFEIRYNNAPQDPTSVLPF
jgi:murein DD-endopeptidase MepM/ murein hydrolase activator NlpD